MGEKNKDINKSKKIGKNNKRYVIIITIVILLCCILLIAYQWKNIKNVFKNKSVAPSNVNNINSETNNISDSNTKDSKQDLEENSNINSTNSTAIESNNNNTNIDADADADTTTGTTSITNINDIAKLSLIKNQCFSVKLNNSWNDIKFLSGKITNSNHTSTVFYLTKQNGDILFDFNDSPFPYNTDVSSVAFNDVNKDGLKDIVIIVTQNDNNNNPIAAVWLQGTDNKFACNMDLFHDINDSKNNKNMKSVLNYISTRY